MIRNNKLFKPKEIVLSNGKVVLQPRSKTVPIILLLLIFSYWAVQITGFNMTTLIRRGNQFFVLLEAMIPPNTAYLPRIIGPLFDTIKMSLLGTFIGSVLAIPFAIIASSNLVKSPLIISISRFFISLLRTFPTLIVALVATYIFGLGTIAGTTAITIFTFSFVGKLLYEQIETVEMGAYEAMEAMGTNKTKSFVVAIAPQVFPIYISNVLFCFEGNVRHAAILGYVGAGGIGLILNEKLGWREYENVGMILVALFVAVFVIETISRYIRSKLI